jgi:hypothetical protein
VRTSVEVVLVCKYGGDGRSHERGMQERLHRTWPLGVDLVQAVYRLVQLDAEFDLPAHPVQVGDLPRAEPWWEIREGAPRSAMM